ncbi:MAG: TonB-dependent receptor [Polyangiaceae bacterium]|nr:TonB-dependent receptor [Polyangiaceae bacterium]MCW5792260.1 TonB-dependent receptor [Polyangiaceae bacterium]
MVVAGSPARRAAGSAHVIREAELERYEYDDPAAVLSVVPGLYSRGEDGVGLRPNLSMRGVSPDRSKKLTLLEDGLPFGPAPYSAPAAYYFPLMTHFSGVRVLKGPGAMSYGPQTVAGVVDFISRPIPTRTTAHIDLATGEYAHRKAHAYFGTSDGQTGFLIEGVHLGNDGFKELPSGADTGFVRNAWKAHASYSPNPTARLRSDFSIRLGYDDEISNETYLGLTDADLEASPNRRYAATQLDRMEWHRSSLVLSHTLTGGPGFKLTTSVYRHDLTRSWRKVNRFRGASLFDVLTNPDGGQNAVFAALLSGQADSSGPAEAIMIGPNARKYVSQGLDTRVRWDTSTGPLQHRFEYGATLHYDRIERRHSEDAFLIVGDTLVPEGSPTLVTAFNEAATHAVALHLNDAISYDALTVTPGVRVEALASRFLDRTSGNSTGSSTVAVMPGLGAFYALLPDFGVLAGAYRGFSPPAPGSAEHVDPEFSWNLEGGLRFAPGRSRLEAIGFYNHYTNLTDVCTFSSGCLDANLDRQFDAGKARIYGLEVYGEHALRVAEEISLPLSVSYTYSKSEFLTDFESEDPIFGVVEAGDELPYIPAHQLQLRAGVEGGRFGVYGAFMYVASTREQAGSEPLDEVLSTDSQASVDVGGRFDVTSNLQVYTQVRNVTDARYIIGHRPYGARPNAPRWIQVGLKAGF